MAKLKKAFFSEDGAVLFFWLDTGTLEWILLPDVTARSDVSSPSEESDPSDLSR